MTAAVLVLGLLIFAVLLWTANRFFAVPPGPVDEARHALLTSRFALIEAAHGAAGMATALFVPGCGVSLCLLFLVAHRPRMRVRLLWAAAAVTDAIYTLADYVLPIWNWAPPTAALAVAISAVGDWIGRRGGK